MHSNWSGYTVFSSSNTWCNEYSSIRLNLRFICTKTDRRRRLLTVDANSEDTEDSLAVLID